MTKTFRFKGRKFRVTNKWGTMEHSLYRYEPRDDNWSFIKPADAIRIGLLAHNKIVFNGLTNGAREALVLWLKEQNEAANNPHPRIWGWGRPTLG